ncbi:MAG: penicillin acylase family protein [Anaerolineae bacterium]|nr:penicillin acylase family protein [Anaerolineae bacterium]
MKRLARVLIGIGLVVMALAIILAGTGVWFVRRPWSQVKGELAIQGLTAPVEVIRDEWGVPHIYAENEHDLFFAQGYVHAQDRLWQMEFNRRIGSGTLSAALGDTTLDTDRFLRTIGLRRAAEKDMALLDGETRAILEAYAAGVNAYVDAHRHRLPLEFTILGVDPAPWTPVDTLAWGKVMAYNLCSNYDYELLRARIIAEAGQSAAQDLLPPYPGGAPVIVPAEARGYNWLRDAEPSWPAALTSLLGTPGAGWGSNNWVVHGTRTATGKPLLADDTHLGLNMPSIWYENGLHGGRFDVAGYSFPGVPMVIIGHNQRIAWGVTNLPADVQDFYIEELNDSTNPTQYAFGGQWQDLEVVRETIEVKDAPPVTLDVRITHHGPIMNDVLGGMEDAQPLALRWTVLDGTYLFKAVLMIDLAANWDQFRQGLSYWEAPSQNFVYADVEGNIGYQTPGKIPIRAAGHQGLVPVPGWTGEYEWQGYIPFDELPRAFNPPAGFIVSANNKVPTDSYPYHLAYEWAAPYRAQRITDLLAADDSMTVAKIEQIHAQTYSLWAEALRPYLLAVQPENDAQQRALDLVEEWDLYLETDRVGASIFETWYWFLVKNTLHDDLSDDLLADYLPYEDDHILAMTGLLAQPDSPWFDDRTTAAVETRDDIARHSLADAVAWLSEQYGDNPGDWEWGRLHTMTFVHQPLGQSGIGLLENLFNSQTIPARGDPLTVDAAWFSFAEPFAMYGGASQRYIADLSDWGNSVIVHATGQSGQLAHPHRDDFIAPWQEVRYHSMLFGRQAVEANAEATLTLTPP